MSYDNPQTEYYSQPSSAFGATTESTRFMGPKGKIGYVRDIDVFLSADAVGTTSVPEISVGATQGSAEYARFRLGTTAILGYTAAAGPRRATQVANANPATGLAFEDFPGHVKLGTARIPADTGFYISRVAGVGTPAGTGSSRVIIDWM